MQKFSYIFKVQFTKTLNFYMQGKKSFWGSMFSLMTLQNSMDERKLKNYQHFISVYSLLWVCVYVCVCVCVQGRPCVCEVEWRGLSFQCDSEEGWGRGRGRDRQTWLAEIVFTLWPESDGNRTALPNRVLQIHRYTESVLRQNTADPSHIYNSSRPGETSVSARRTQDLLCVCCSICVSLSP